LNVSYNTITVNSIRNKSKDLDEDKVNSGYYIKVKRNYNIIIAINLGYKVNSNPSRISNNNSNNNNNSNSSLTYANNRFNNTNNDYNIGFKKI